MRDKEERYFSYFSSSIRRKANHKKGTKLNNGNPLNKENIPRLVLDWVDNTVLLKKGKELGLQNDSVLLRKRDVFFNNLIISSFWDQKQALKISVSRKEVLDYYNKNKESFYRETEEVFLEHYFTEELVFQKIKIFFILNKRQILIFQTFIRIKNG